MVADAVNGICRVFVSVNVTVKFIVAVCVCVFGTFVFVDVGVAVGMDGIFVSVLIICAVLVATGRVGEGIFLHPLEIVIQVKSIITRIQIFFTI